MVHHPDVAGLQPAVRGDGARGFLGVVQVAAHHVEAPAPDLPGGADRHDRTRRIHTFHLHPVHGPARGVGDAFGAVIRPADGYHATGLGQAVGGHHHFETQLRAHLLHQRHRHRRRAGDRQAQAAQVEFATPRVGQQGLVDGRRPRDHGDALAGDARQHRVQVEALHRQHVGAPYDRRQPSRLVPEGMEKRVDNQVVVITPEADRGTPGLEGADILAMAGDHPLGLAGGAGGKQDVQGVLRGQRVRPPLHLGGRHAPAGGQEIRPGRCARFLALQQHDLLQRRQGVLAQRRRVVDPQEITDRKQQAGAAGA